MASDCFERLLKQVFNCDPMDNIHPKYCVDLHADLLTKRKFLASLIDSLGSFAESSLRQNILNDAESILTVLEYVLDDAELFTVIKEHLPAKGRQVAQRLRAPVQCSCAENLDPGDA